MTSKVNIEAAPTISLIGLSSSLTGKQSGGSTKAAVEDKQNQATALIAKIGTGDPKPKSIPCGYQEPDQGSGRSIACGAIYRGQTFYCRDCMSKMLEQSADLVNTMAEVMLVTVNDYAITGAVPQSTIDGMRDFLAGLGCVTVD